MTIDDINPTIGATEGTEMGKKKQITNQGQFYKAFRRTVAVVSLQRKDSDSRVVLLEAATARVYGKCIC